MTIKNNAWLKCRGKELYSVRKSERFVLVAEKGRELYSTLGSIAVRRGADDNDQTVEELDEVISLMSGFEAERQGCPCRLG
jgi:hypothetical protein